MQISDYVGVYALNHCFIQGSTVHIAYIQYDCILYTLYILHYIYKHIYMLCGYIYIQCIYSTICTCTCMCMHTHTHTHTRKVPHTQPPPMVTSCLTSTLPKSGNGHWYNPHSLFRFYQVLPNSIPCITFRKHHHYQDTKLCLQCSLLLPIQFSVTVST